MKYVLAGLILLFTVCDGKPAIAHFRLIYPQPWIVEDERGDPHKLWPCGGTIEDGGTRSGIVTAVTGGSKMVVKLDETIYHPGHFRISIAKSPNMLPPDPFTYLKETDRGWRSDWAIIEEDPIPPVLVDGLWQHTEPYIGLRETEITVPNIECEGCFMQVIQFMANHPGFKEGGYTYHHCARIDIVPDFSMPIDLDW